MFEGRSMKMKPTAKNVIAVHKATGLTVFRAKQFILYNPKLCARIIKAKSNSLGLYDPIEDEPSLLVQISEAKAEAEKTVDRMKAEIGLDKSPCHFSWCYTYWCETKRILRDRFGIEWFSPAEMNPRVKYERGANRVAESFPTPLSP